MAALPQRGPRIGVAGPDVVRDARGELVVLEDNVRTPTRMADDHLILASPGVKELLRLPLAGLRSLLALGHGARPNAPSGAGKPGRLEMEGIKGIGDEAYVVRRRSARRAGGLVLFVRRGRSQFSVRFAGVGLELTEPMKQLARSVATN